MCKRTRCGYLALSTLLKVKSVITLWSCPVRLTGCHALLASSFGRECLVSYAQSSPVKHLLSSLTPFRVASRQLGEHCDDDEDLVDEGGGGSDDEEARYGTF